MHGAMPEHVNSSSSEAAEGKRVLALQHWINEGSH